MSLLSVKVICIILLIYSFYLIVKTILFINKIKKDNIILDDIEKQIIVAIPCLREQNCIEETVKYFRKITPDNIPILIITTQKEYKEYDDIKIQFTKDIKDKISKDYLINSYKKIISKKDILKVYGSDNCLLEIERIFKNIKTTKDIVEEKNISKYENVFLIDYPYVEGYMADQLNYAYKNIDDIFTELNHLKTYFCVYNADSRPSKETFNEVLNKIPNNKKIIQQYSYAMKNYDKLNIILKGFSIYQSNFELRTGLINSYFKSKFLYTHVVGHGLFIRMDLLEQINGFNTEFWCEDMFLGLYLKFKNIQITPLISLENMETPETLKSLMKQNAVWFDTTKRFFSMYKNIYTKENKFLFYGLVGCINEFRCCINWLLFPIIVLYMMLIPIIHNNYMLFVISLISYLIFVLSYIGTTIKVINKLDNKNYKVNLELIVGTSLAILISNIGPIYSIIFAPKEKYKTER
ncbi:MAG: glycosyltransferase family 2 protein [Clostridia bacterium]|nr:glycosyltransferase family 2 protein [Clostridia bacterium]MDD4387115.1 glycosyltransferase family 2 protein [Clostridia bacterium]